MKIPSIKTLAIIAHERAKELHAVLAIQTRHDLECFLALATTPDGQPKYERTWKWYRACYNRPNLTHAKLSIADEILNTSGVEYIPAGSNAKSPAIEYCNAGDTYAATLMYVSGRGYKVGCWGDIVERGNYE